MFIVTYYYIFVNIVKSVRKNKIYKFLRRIVLHYLINGHCLYDHFYIHMGLFGMNLFGNGPFHYWACLAVGLSDPDSYGQRHQRSQPVLNKTYWIKTF